MKISTSVMDIQKGDDVEFITYNSKTYVLAGTTAPFTTDNPAKYMQEGVGEIFDENNSPLESMIQKRVHVSSFVLDNEDSILRTDGKFFYAVFGQEVPE